MLTHALHAGHVHAYERTAPVNNYTVDPCGTVHITIGVCPAALGCLYRSRDCVSHELAGCILMFVLTSPAFLWHVHPLTLGSAHISLSCVVWPKGGSLWQCVQGCQFCLEWQTCAHGLGDECFASSTRGRCWAHHCLLPNVQDAGNSEGISFLDKFQDPMLRKPH